MHLFKPMHTLYLDLNKCETARFFKKISESDFKAEHNFCDIFANILKGDTSFTTYSRVHFKIRIPFSNIVIKM